MEATGKLARNIQIVVACIAGGITYGLSGDWYYTVVLAFSYFLLQHYGLRLWDSLHRIR